MENSLLEKYPELAKQWSLRNGDLTPDQISYGSNRIVWWKGPCGHEWDTSVKARTSGEQCPICSGARVVAGINDLKTLRPDLASEWSERNDPFLPTMVSLGSHKKVVWHGTCGHEWIASVRSRVAGTGCPYCSSNLILPGFNDLETRFPDVAAEWSERNFPLKPTMVTAFANKKAWWKCEQGHEWYTLISTRSGGSKCPYCSDILLLKGFNDFATRFPDLAKEWSEKNYPLKPDEVNEKSRLNVWWKCGKCGHEWKSLVKSRVKGVGCPACTEYKVIAGINDLLTTDPELCEEWDFDLNGKVSPQHISRNALRSVWWRCDRGHTWKDRIVNRTIEKAGCRICEQEFELSLPTLLIILYAGRNRLRLLLEDEDLIGLPIQAYIPELSIAFDILSLERKENQRQCLVKAHLCEQQGVNYTVVPYTKSMSHADIVNGICAVFRKGHFHIESDVESDVQLARAAWQRLKAKERLSSDASCYQCE